MKKHFELFELVMKNLETLGKTWLIDLDGTLVLHNGYKDSGDQLLESVQELWDKFKLNDKIIILTGRHEKYRIVTEQFLSDNNLRYDLLIMDLPTGMRVLINDAKPDGTSTAMSINLVRNQGVQEVINLISLT